ncbi:patatin-like phospholipase family protein [Hoeflea sp. AS16]|uniref:patatin-like phospholipase family protein n=1 Tax=Hoeflea sp. AS16 TaxID=3135779 RepID=UPI00316D7772
MTSPQRKCDLVMKGGITSGVVYPMAVVELAKEYRFQNIGGTSAGAIAAVVTAAAEYGRDKGGFEKIAELPNELSADLIGKFQPVPELRPLFNLMLAAMSKSVGKIVAALLENYRRRALIWALPGIVIAIALGIVSHSLGFTLLGLLLAVLGAFAGAGAALLRQVTVTLPKHDYGICPGLTQAGSKGAALTDWLSETIDSVAGLDDSEGPLTIAHLKEKGINVKTVTTDITTHRPYILPIANNNHAFSEAEFRKLFPRKVVDHMVSCSSKVSANWGKDAGDLRYFQSDQLPVVVLARMSLSFPGLISAVPLHRIDYTLVNEAVYPAIKRCLFSDGGLSSNFPVHFFDEFLPQTPTFGVSLSEYHPMRIRKEDANKPKAGRITLPIEAAKGRLLPTHDFKGLLGFVMAMFDSAKDWQDSLQSILPGYRERIVTVNLKESEGGLNLQMESSTIKLLSDFGQDAGQEINDKFDLDEHRWRRYLVEVQAIEEMLEQFANSYSDTTPQPGSLAYPDLAVNYQPKSFGELKPAQREVIKAKAEKIAALGKALTAETPISKYASVLPKSQSRLRNIANMDQ